MIAGEEQVQIAMGVFDTFRVECSRQEPEKWIFYYAPRIGYYVKMEATGLKNGATSSRTLKGYVKNAVAYGDIEPAMAAAMPAMTEPAKVTTETMPEMDKPEEEMARKPEEPAKAEEGTQPVSGEAKMEKNPAETAMKPVTGEAKPTMTQPAASSNGFVLHLASYKQQANLERGQQDLLKKFPTQLSGMSFSSKRVDLGSKGVYYRLYVGPTTSRASADSLCQQLKARGQYCIVNKTP
ncbi:SPOR domain-containing protein [Aestuariispira insulae]|nr:SPOR domain-containing protein [Aestuariispira insulae]